MNYSLVKYCNLILVLASYTLFSVSIKAQNCIDYAEIDGPACGFCVPEGWTMEFSSPDLVDPESFPCMTSPSPSGGTAMHLFSNGNNDIEAVSTVFQIPNFNENEEYYFGMYFYTCGAHDVTIQLSINGEGYEISSFNDWEYFEQCLELDSETVEIYITVEDYEGGAITNTLIDSGICDPTFCCTLEASLDDEYIELCPGEEFEISGDMDGGEGDIEIEWTSDPAYGVDFLSDPNILEPTIIVPYSEEFDGDIFLFTVIIEDEECMISRSFELEVHPSLIPEFDIFLCELFEDYDLPPQSLEYYSGTWEGDFDFDELGGEVSEYTFTLDPGQDNCIQQWTYEFLIHTEELIYFDFEQTYCVNDEDTYTLPEETDEKIEGEWSERKFTPDELGVGTHKFTFYPNTEEFCADEYVFEITVIAEQTPTFNLANSYCTSNDTIFLPTLSNEGIPGTWNQSFIDLNVEAFEQGLIFTTGDNDCYANFETSYTVISDLQASFDIHDTICGASGFISLDGVSLEGYAGDWTPSMVSLDTITGSIIEFEWTPQIEQNSCLSAYSQIINIVDNVTVEMQLPKQLCYNSGIFTLPTTSINGIQGVWNISEINTDTIVTEKIEIIFSPIDDSCAKVYIDSILILESNTADITFDFANTFCQDDMPLVLPSVSSNGVPGLWSAEIVDPAIISDSLSVVFYPVNSPGTCYDSLTVWFFSQEQNIPEFELPEILCINEGNYMFPIQSINGISGEWTFGEFDPSVNGQVNSFSNTFIPAQTCADMVEITLPVLNFDDVDVMVTDAQSCTTNDGFFEILSSSLDLELSIDGGLNWSDNLFRDDLASGEYEIYLRYKDTDCVEIFEIQIFAPSSIKIDEIAVDSIKGCSDDFASVTALSGNNDIEYSIDQGVSWQDSNVFEEISPGDYILMARSTISSDCRDSINFNIEGFEESNIFDFHLVNDTSCINTVGQISILATGLNLEYSIDDGMSWQVDGEFSNLSAGEYFVKVRSSDAVDCIDSSKVEILGVEMTAIISSDIQNVSSCEDNNGRISITAEGVDLEYSIDQGNNWQASSLFENLSPGNYDVWARSSIYVDCLDSITLMITSADAPIISSVSTQDVTSCIEANGRIEIIASGSDLEYSADGGTTWSSSSVFTNLEDGVYNLAVREVMMPDCITSQEVEIFAPKALELEDVIIVLPSSCDESDGSIEFIVNQMDVEFSIDNGFTWDDSGIFADLSPGQYSIIINSKEYSDCSISYDFEIDNPDCPCGNLIVLFSTEPVDCINPLSGTVTITEIEGNAMDDILVVWENGDQGLTASNLPEGWVTFVIDYDRNCNWTDSAYIESIDPVTFDLLTFDQDCEGLGSIEVINFMGGSGNPAYSVDGISFQENSVFTNLSAQEYEVFIQDIFNCSGSESTEISDNSDLQVSLPDIEPIAFGESVFLNPLINEMTIDSFHWFPSDGIINPNQLIAQVSPIQTTVYTLTIYFGSCVEVRSIEVEVKGLPDIYLGNIFSPNGDGNNEIFKIQSRTDLDIEISEYRIYDRWGNLAFEKSNFPVNEDAFGWDGRIHDKDAELGVYVYVVVYYHENVKYVKSGSLTLIR